MSSHALTVRLADGRLLEAVAGRDPDGALLVFHHGSPAAAVPFVPFDRAAVDAFRHGAHWEFSHAVSTVTISQGPNAFPEAEAAEFCRAGTRAKLADKP